MEHNSSEKPDVEALMARIRSEVKSELAAGQKENRPRAPKKVDLGKTAPTSVLYSEELNFLNAHWHDLSSISPVSSHRRLLGPYIVRAKRFILEAVWEYLLKGYFERERQFNMNLVRLLNDFVRYADARDSQIFWEIVQKVDSDVRALNERMDLLHDESVATISDIEQQMQRKLNQKGGQVKQ